jgi:hypothetical protein
MEDGRIGKCADADADAAEICWVPGGRQAGRQAGRPSRFFSSPAAAAL